MVKFLGLSFLHQNCIIIKVYRAVVKKIKFENVNIMILSHTLTRPYVTQSEFLESAKSLSLLTNASIHVILIRFFFNPPPGNCGRWSNNWRRRPVAVRQIRWWYEAVYVHTRRTIGVTLLIRVYVLCISGGAAVQECKIHLLNPPGPPDASHVLCNSSLELWAYS